MEPLSFPVTYGLAWEWVGTLEYGAWQRGRRTKSSSLQDSGSSMACDSYRCASMGNSLRKRAFQMSTELGCQLEHVKGGEGTAHL